MSNESEKLLLTTAEAAARMGVSRSALYDLIRTRRIRSVKIGNRRYVPVDAPAEAVAALVEETEAVA